MLFKQFFYLLILGIIVVYFNNSITIFLQTIATYQDWLANSISALLPIAASNTNTLISSTITLTISPFIIVIIPAFLYWLSKQKELPNLYPTTWFIWVILTLIFILPR